MGWLSVAAKEVYAVSAKPMIAESASSESDGVPADRTPTIPFSAQQVTDDFLDFADVSGKRTSGMPWHRNITIPERKMLWRPSK